MSQPPHNTFEKVKDSPAGEAETFGEVRQGIRMRPQSRGVQLTGQRFFGCLFLLFVAMLVVYMAGVMVGRHQLDRELLWAEKMPQEKSEESAKPQDAGGEEEASQEGSADGSRILKPQELAFSRFLRAAPGEKVSEPKPLENFKPFVPATNSTTVVQVPMAPGMSPATAGGGPPEKPETAAELYDFVFQVAAFRSSADAEETRIQLEAEGFRSRLEKNGRLHIVLLLSRGPLSRIQEIREVTERLHLGAPIERSRKAVLRPIGVR